MPQSRKGKTNRNIVIGIVACVCLFVFMIPTPSEMTESEMNPPIPYTVRKSPLRKGGGMVYDYAKIVGHKIPKPYFKSHPDSPLSNSRPHPVQDFPEFQEKMYKLTADNWSAYEKILVDFSREALPKQMARWSVEMIRDRSPARIPIRAHAGKKIPDTIWQTGKDFPTTRTSFQEMNPRASYNFYDDTLLEDWASKHFLTSLVKKTWDGMERVVLKADFWRYLVTFLEGGYYSGG